MQIHQPNQAQRDAIEVIDGPLLVMAGPGAGKTEVSFQSLLTPKIQVCKAMEQNDRLFSRAVNESCHDDIETGKFPTGQNYRCNPSPPISASRME